MRTDLDSVIRSVRKGIPTLIFDSSGRERETDIVVPSQLVNPGTVRMMRKDGGGLVCTTLTHDAAVKLGLDYIVNMLNRSGYGIFRYLQPDDIPYDEKSAFSITINHRKTFTGIPDRDRSLTITEFAGLLHKADRLKPAEARKEFGRSFRSPGHVHLLIARKGLVMERKGHTELSTSLMILSGLTPSATIVEMLGDDGLSLKYGKAKDYAKAHNYPFLEGKEIMKWWAEKLHR